jgi:hypothetical protein
MSRKKSGRTISRGVQLYLHRCGWVGEWDEKGLCNRLERKGNQSMPES